MTVPSWSHHWYFHRRELGLKNLTHLILMGHTINKNYNLINRRKPFDQLKTTGTVQGQLYTSTVSLKTLITEIQMYSYNVDFAWIANLHVH